MNVVNSSAVPRTALITGASGGIGAAICYALAKDGFRIGVHYHTQKEKANALVERLHAEGVRACALSADLADLAAVSRLFSACERTLGAPDVLVYSAGISEYGLVQDLTPQLWRRVFSVNVDGAFYCTKAALPHMIDRKWGRIIHIASMWGMVGASCETLYSASKGALLAFTKACAKELVYSGITVNAVAPGAVRTPMLDQLGEKKLKELCEEIPIRRLIEPEEIAAWVSLLAGDAGASMTGQVISPNGGMVIV
uniref:elongation factor P 5-aminopentanone reductase n=1 Tax=Ndongobacter massiliensis TaxID=1871025 RepID=UPI0009301291|nr:3-oxoacyl-ACP reductase FabG [Ndongobacter massiliensis]